MNHAIIIRFHYPKDHPKFEFRFNHFKNVTLPSILSQTDQNFDIAIRCNPIHAKILEDLSPKICTFQVKNEKEGYVKKYGSVYFQDFTAWENVIGLPKYEIQSGLDSDDVITATYIETVHRLLKEHGPGRSMHISFQPMVFDVNDLSRVEPIGIRYRPRKGSAFFTIYQPDVVGKRYFFAYEKSHLEIGKFMDDSIVVPEGYAYVAVHGFNESTKMRKKEQ
jgi:hypothetical protein